MPATLLLSAAALLCALSMGLRQSFGLFLPDIVLAQGWSASAVSFALAAQVLLNGVFQPLCGNLADRIGGRPVLLAGWLLYGAGLALMAVADSFPLFLVAAAPVLGLAVSAAGFPVVMASLSRLLPPNRRGRAAGLATAASSFGQFSVVPLAQGAIALFGWQGALLAMALLALAAVPLASPFADRPPPPRASDQSARTAIGEAMASAQFWCLAAGFFVCGLHVSFLSLHLPAYVASCGLHPSWGATSIGLIGLFNIVGSLVSGELANRWRRRELLVAIYGARAVAMAAFLAAPKTGATLALFSAVMGVLWLSTVPPTVALLARAFGPRWLATLFGLVFLSHQIGGFAGGLLAGAIWDQTGSYEAMWWLAIAAGAFAAVINLPVRDPTVPAPARA